MTREQIEANVAKALGFESIDTLAATHGDLNVANEHNIREAWNATVDRIAEFQTKYVEVSNDGGGKAQQES
jgi:hypothetical protein